MITHRTYSHTGSTSIESIDFNDTSLSMIGNFSEYEDLLEDILIHGTIPYIYYKRSHLLNINYQPRIRSPTDLMYNV